MKNRSDMSTPCVVKTDSIVYAQSIGLVDTSADAGECRAESIKQMTAYGLTVDDMNNLDIRQPVLQAVREYARLDIDSQAPHQRTVDAVYATLKVVQDQLRDLDIELDMLSIRKQALIRRTKTLEKLANLLEDDQDELLSA